MNFDDLEAKLICLISFPLKSQIKIDFDRKNKSFFISSSIYRSRKELPISIKKYVKAREGKTFKPHKTSFELRDGTVCLVQEFPFKLQCQETLRKKMVQFWHMAKKCHQMLMEIAAEEKLALK